MQVFLGIFLGFLWIFLVILVRSLTTFFHEMGHAVFALAFTKKAPVYVLVGTYGDISRCLNINLGRLQLYLKINLFDWKLGVCMYNRVDDFWKNLLVCLGGPIASLLIAGSILFWMVQAALSDTWIVLASLFLIAALIDFCVNIYPGSKPIYLYDGRTTHCDGYQIYQLILQRQYPASYTIALQCIQENKYDEAIDLGQQLLADGCDKKAVYRLLTEAHRLKKEYPTAIEVYNSWEQKHTLDANDAFQKALILMDLKRYNEALPLVNQTIYYDQFNAVAKQARGLILTHQGHYEQAQMDLDAAIYRDPTNVAAYCSRAFLHLKTSAFAQAQTDLEKAQSLNPDYAYLHYYWGQYHEAQADFRQALDAYQKAADLNIEYHGIQHCIAEMEQQVNL